MTPVVGGPPWWPYRLPSSKRRSSSSNATPSTAKSKLGDAAAAGAASSSDVLSDMEESTSSSMGEPALFSAASSELPATLYLTYPSRRIPHSTLDRLQLVSPTETSESSTYYSNRSSAFSRLPTPSRTTTTTTSLAAPELPDAWSLSSAFERVQQRTDVVSAGPPLMPDLEDEKYDRTFCLSCPSLNNAQTLPPSRQVLLLSRRETSSPKLADFEYSSCEDSSSMLFCDRISLKTPPAATFGGGGASGGETIWTTTNNDHAHTERAPEQPTDDKCQFGHFFGTLLHNVGSSVVSTFGVSAEHGRGMHHHQNLWSPPSPSSPQTLCNISNIISNNIENAMEPCFLCPIGGSVMQDPVVDAEGYSYDRDSIVHWIVTHGTSPMTERPMSVKDLRPNRALQSVIEHYYRTVQEAKNDGSMPKSKAA